MIPTPRSFLKTTDGLLKFTSIPTKDHSVVSSTHLSSKSNFEVSLDVYLNEPMFYLKTLLCLMAHTFRQINQVLNLVEYMESILDLVAWNLDLLKASLM
jgi:hypothetical protein